MHTINRCILAVLVPLVFTAPVIAQSRVYQSITDDVAIRVIATVDEDTTTLRSFYTDRPERWVCEAFPDRLECTLDYFVNATITPDDGAIVFEEGGDSRRFEWANGVYRRETEQDDTEHRSTEIRIGRSGSTVSVTVLEWYEEGVLEFPTRGNGQYRYSVSDSESIFINVSDEEIAVFNPAYPEEFQTVPQAVGDATLRIASVLPEPPRFPDLTRPSPAPTASPSEDTHHQAQPRLPYASFSIESMREIAVGEYTPIAIDPSGSRVFALRSESTEETALALFSIPQGLRLCETVVPFAYRPILEHVAWSPSGDQLVTSTRSTFYAEASESGLLLLDGRNGSGGFVTDHDGDSFPLWIDESRFGFLRHDGTSSEVDLFIAERAGTAEGVDVEGAAPSYRVVRGFPNVASYLSTADVAFLPATGELYLSSLPLSGEESAIRRVGAGAVAPSSVAIPRFSPSERTTYFGEFGTTGRWAILWPGEYIEAGPTRGTTADTAVPSIVAFHGESSPQRLLPVGTARYLYAAAVSPDERSIVLATYDPRTRREALVLRGVDSGRVQGPPITLLSRENLGFDPIQSARSFHGSLRWTDADTILYINSDRDQVVVVDLTAD